MKFLPPPLKLCINQMKIFLKHNCKEDTKKEDLDELIKNLIKCVEDVCKRTKSMENLTETQDLKIKKLNDKILSLEQELKIKSSEYSSLNNSSKGKAKKKKYDEEMNLKLENCRLSKLN